MIKSIQYFLSVLATVLFSAKAYSAVIYVDVNNNIEERSAYVSALARENRNEQFIAIPQIDLSAAQLLTELGDLRDSTWVRYVKLGCVQDFKWQPVLGNQCNEVQKSLWSLETRIREIHKTNLTAESLEAALKNVRVREDEKITLVISGHFGGGVFTGNLGSMSVEEMGRVFNRFPQIQRQIVRLHLLGCYTNVFSQVSTLWRANFPQVRVLAGFYERSPAGNDSRNLSFIRFLVRNTENIDKIRTAQQFQRSMTAFQTYSSIHAALAVDNMYRETGDELMFVDQTSIPVAKCRARLTAQDRDYFENVFIGRLPLPNDTDGSRLRHYYSALRDNALCLNEAEFTNGQERLPSPDLAMRLLFFKNVIINFRNLYRDQVAHFDQLILQSGVDRSLTLQQVDLSQRAAIIAWGEKLERVLPQLSNSKDLADISTLYSGFQKILIQLSPNCVPVNWVEPSAFMPSACLAR